MKNFHLFLPYRMVRQEEDDQDLYIDTQRKVLNLYLQTQQSPIKRIQFPCVQAILIRLQVNSPLLTVHLLQNIDLFSAFANFEIDLSYQALSIKDSGSEISVRLTSLNLNQEPV